MEHPRTSAWRTGLELALLSFAVLFQELTLIRWLGGQVRVLAYFPNVVLMSAFLGLGVGCLRAGRPPRVWAWPAALLALTAAAAGLGRVAFTEESVSEHLWLLYYGMENAPVVHGVRLPIVAVFVLSGACFVVPGQMVARRLARFGGDGPGLAGSLWGYFADLTGSLLGVAGFALASFVRTFPVVWFAVVLVAGGAVASAAGRRGTAARVVLFAVLATAVLVVVAANESADRYSPYYAVRTIVQPGSAGVQVLVNGSLHQYAAPVRRGDVDPTGFAFDRTVRAGYHSPYRYLSRPPRRVLVLGAGTGNDVATALDEGAEHVDAVEIDPVILGLGRAAHPDRPYASPKVRAVNTDARNFLNRTDEQYDLVIFGTLDSMTRLSALSSVRLDNFVYTRDCLAAARRHVTPDGGIMMLFMVGTDYIGDRLWHMLADAFGGRPPLVQAHNYGMFNQVLMDGPAFDRGRALLPPTDGGRDYGQVPTDDWPYLYLRHRTVSRFYLSLIATFAAMAVAAVAVAAPALVRRAGRRDGTGFDAEMFGFGVAFLLLETKSVTEMNLVWGGTWLTTAVVFGSILAMLLAATAATQVRPLPWRASVAGLVVSLLAGYAVPVQLLVGRSTPVAAGLSALFVGLPIFFASICFALRFRTRREPEVAFGWNLLGAVGGGLLEFASMAVGCRALSLVALGVYGLSFALGRGRPGRVPAVEPALP